MFYPGDIGRPGRHRLRAPKILLLPDPETGGSHLFPTPSNPLNRAANRLARTHARMREDVKSIQHSVLASRRAIGDAREAIAQADEIRRRQTPGYLKAPGTSPTLGLRVRVVRRKFAAR